MEWVLRLDRDPERGMVTSTAWLQDPPTNQGFPNDKQGTGKPYL